MIESGDWRTAEGIWKDVQKETEKFFHSYDTEYSITVYLYDGYIWRSKDYTFRTEAEPQDVTIDSPSEISVVADGRFGLDLSWVKAHDKTRIEYRFGSGDWARGNGNLLYEGSGVSVSFDGLSSSITR